MGGGPPDPRLFGNPPYFRSLKVGKYGPRCSHERHIRQTAYLTQQKENKKSPQEGTQARVVCPIFAANSKRKFWI